jgi:Flp pilus assembly protein TadD/SAM-dependent methyltransferase
MEAPMRPPSGPTTSPTPDALAAALALARAHHEAGRLREAEVACRDVLERAPDHPEALHRLGILAWQTGRGRAAVDLLNRALALRPDEAEYHHDLGSVLQSQGRLDDALASFRRTTALAPAHADAYFNAGTVLQQQGRDDEAAASYAQALVHAPDLADAHVNLGTLEDRAGRVDEAIGRYERALALAPRSVHALFNLGNALRARGRLDEAAARYREAIACAPSNVVARVNLGAALMAQGRYDEAATAYGEAVTLRPDTMLAQYGLAQAHAGQGRLDDSISRYRRALRLAPDDARVHNDYGATLARRGRTQDACAEFRAALALQPDFAEAHANLGHALDALGDVAGAVGSHRRALALRDTPQIAANLGHCLRALEHEGVDVPDADALLAEALQRRWARPGDLARAVARRIDAAGLRADDLQELSRSTLLRALLERTPVQGASMERLLTGARTRLLEAVLAGDAGWDDALLGFACALARQCFLNEYVFAWDDAEAARVQALRNEVADAIARGGNDSIAPRGVAPPGGGASPGSIAPQRLAALGMYAPLGSLPGAARMLEHAWPAPVHALLVQQVAEPADEQRRAAAIERLTDIRDPVSLAVQRQYEDHPYPRWTTIGTEAPWHTPDAWLRPRFPAVRLLPSAQPGAPDILVAGCGTGREAIETAQRFPSARVLAIDLSRASLAYAQRMSDAHGVRNVRYAQADIAALGALGRSFDVVSAVGVLHHMADPAAALRTLASLLRPHGFLQLGLYSEAARRQVAQAQRFVAGQGFAPDADGIRRARTALRAEDEGRRFAAVTQAADFYSTSECRDLLFHVHEARFTLLQVRDLLRDAGLRVLGLVIDPRRLARYAAQFPEDARRNDLECWSAFEAQHPDTFTGMYVVWTQKR